MKYRKKDGSIMWGLQNSRLVQDDQGNILYIEGTFQDITGRKTAEEALRESEHMFRDLTEKSLVGIYLIQDGVFRYVNSRFAEIIGLQCSRIDRNDTLRRNHLARRPRHGYRESSEERIRGSLRQFTICSEPSRKKEIVRNVEVYGSRTTYRGRPAVIGTMLDISERARSEEFLKQAEEMYRGIFENAIEGIFQTSASHELMTANDSLVKIFGYNTAEEFMADLRGGRPICSSVQTNIKIFLK